MKWTVVITFTCALANIICAPLNVSPCSKDDTKCLTDLTTLMFQSVIPGIEELGIPSLDPMDLELVEGNLETVKYTLTNSKLYLFKDCIIDTTSLSDGKNAEIQMTCPKFRMTGKFDMAGDLIGIPIDEDGDFSIEGTDAYMTLATELERIPGDGKPVLSLKISKINPEIKGSLVFKVENVNTRNKSVPTETAVQVLNENWQTTAGILQAPIFQSCVGKLADNVNKLLKTIPYDSILKS